MEELEVDNVIICEQGKYSKNYDEFRNIVDKKKIKVLKVKKRRCVKNRRGFKY